MRLRKLQPIVVLICFTGFVVLPSMASAGAFPAFGPEDFLRGTGEPATVTRSFAILHPAAAYTLEIYNGGLNGEFKRASSSVIRLNGIQVAGPDEFNQNVAFITKPIFLNTTNELAVELRGNPATGSRSWSRGR